MGGPGSSRPAVTAYLISEMHQRLTEPCTFIIDDWQYVEGVTEVRGLWNQLLRDAPPTCRFIFASRARPKLQFARFKTHGGFAQLTTNDLRFTDREIDDLFREIYADPLQDSEISELERRTEGWAASLQLIEVSLRDRSTPEERRMLIESIAATTDSDLFSYLAEEVLDGQSEAVRNFLLSTSILHQVTPELAERLAGVHDGPRMLADLEQQGLFTYRLDAEAHRYRYHHLFRDFLERRLLEDRGEAEITGLHIHAASYFETTARWPEAIHHYLRAGLHRQAARLIARYGEDIVSDGRVDTMDEWLEQLSKRTVEDSARLSLLYGESQRMHGEWTKALAALERARSFFARKQDRRLEALACQKLSTTYFEMAEFRLADGCVRDGLELVPESDQLTRLRLEGNAAVIAEHLGGDLTDALKAYRRLAARAERMGLDHYVAVALHNLGITQRFVGLLEESVNSLSRAISLWKGLAPRNPYCDNSDLAESLLAAGRLDQAARAADEGVRSTRGWQIPQATALWGRCSVDVYNGRFDRAISTLRTIFTTEADLGLLAPTGHMLLFDALRYSGSAVADLSAVLADWNQVRCPRRIAVAREIASVRVDHLKNDCSGQCQRAVAGVRWLEDHGFRLDHIRALIDVGPLRAQHGDSDAIEMMRRGLVDADQQGVLHCLRWPLRDLSPHLAVLVGDDPAVAALVEQLLRIDTAYWREPVVASLEGATGRARQVLLNTYVKFANHEAASRLRALRGRDVAEARIRIVRSRAPRVFATTFGPMSLRRGGFDGPELPIAKRRLRALLGLLLAYKDSSVTREYVIDTLWPEAAPDAAVNSLNQSVFQLRHAIDADYRDADSPQYIVATPESLALDKALVRTDLEEFRRRFEQLTNKTVPDCELLDGLLGLVRGEYLADIRYEDWAEPLRAAVHAEVRTMLFTAVDVAAASPELAYRASAILVEFDEYDERAQSAMVRSLLAMGRRAAAHQQVRRFAQKLREDLQEVPSAEFLSLPSGSTA